MYTLFICWLIGIPVLAIATLYAYQWDMQSLPWPTPLKTFDLYDIACAIGCGLVPIVGIYLICTIFFPQIGKWLASIKVPNPWYKEVQNDVSSND